MKNKQTNKQNKNKKQKTEQKQANKQTNKQKISEEKYLTTQKYTIFARDNYSFHKTTENKSKQWTHYSALKHHTIFTFTLLSTFSIFSATNVRHFKCTSNFAYLFKDTHPHTPHPPTQIILNKYHNTYS